MTKHDNTPWKKVGLTEAQWWKDKYLKELEKHSSWKTTLEEIASFVETPHYKVVFGYLQQKAEDALKEK
jgi:hypothetical protein